MRDHLALIILTTHFWCLLSSLSVISKSPCIFLLCLFILHIIRAKCSFKSLKYDWISPFRFKSVHQYIQMSHLILTSRRRCYSDRSLISHLRLLPIGRWLLWAFHITWSENQIKDLGALKLSWLYTFSCRKPNIVHSMWKELRIFVVVSNIEMLLH